MSELLGLGAKPAPDVIKDGSIETFEADVLNASMEAPVIVDFWAEWCGPCKQLAPALEKAVKAANGKVRLVKIDIDKNQMLASQLRIQSVPTVYAFWQGRPVDGFQGAVPESEIKAFLDRLTSFSGGDGQGAIEDHLEAAESLMAEGDIAGAAEIFGRVAEAAPDNLRALAGLARAHVALKEFDQARAIIDLAPEAKRNDPAFAGVKAALDLAATETGVGDLASLKATADAAPNDLSARFDYAGAAIAAGRMEEALEALLHIIERDREWNDEAARHKLLTVFQALGPTHPLTVRGRRRLSSILFS